MEEKGHRKRKGKVEGDMIKRKKGVVALVVERFLALSTSLSRLSFDPLYMGVA